MPEYDPRFCCPTCNRAPLPPDFALLFPVATAAMLTGMELSHLMERDAAAGRLPPGSRQICLNGHTWTVPRVDVAAAAAEVEPETATTATEEELEAWAV